MRLAFMSYAKYHTMANLIVHYLRRKEAEAEESGQGDAMPGKYTHSMVYVGYNGCCPNRHTDKLTHSNVLEF